MIDLSAPYILYVAIAYGATALTLAGILLIQWRQYRTTQRQLEQFRDKL